MPSGRIIKALFDDIAPHYDLLNHLLSFGTDRIWRARAVRILTKTATPVEMLDIATGTGDFAIAAARKAPAGSNMTGIDLSEKMLEVARKKAKGNILFRQGNCEALDFADDRFDRVSAAFGIRNFEHLESGLAEMHRVVKKGGIMVILELSYPDQAFLAKCFRLYARLMLPIIGKVISGNGKAYRYLPESIIRFPKEDTIVPLLRRIGFTSVYFRKFTFGTCIMYVAQK